MVRKGSPVRLRQWALKNPLDSKFSDARGDWERRRFVAWAAFCGHISPKYPVAGALRRGRLGISSSDAAQAAAARADDARRSRLPGWLGRDATEADRGSAAS